MIDKCTGLGLKFEAMLNYAVVEIKGKQYIIAPNKHFTVDFLGEIKSLECDKVLLKLNGDNLEIGNPYLKDKLSFKVMESTSPLKIRVSKFHAKANYRRTIGSKQKYSRITLDEAVKKV